MLAMTRLWRTSGLALLASVMGLGVSPAGGPHLALAAPPAEGQGVSGVWKWTGRGSDGVEVEVTMTLRQEGERVTGTSAPSGRFARKIDIREGTFKGGELSIP